MKAVEMIKFLSSELLKYRKENKALTKKVEFLEGELRRSKSERDKADEKFDNVLDAINTMCDVDESDSL